MKNSLRAIRFISATLLILIVTLSTAFAENNAIVIGSSGLSGGQIIVCFAILLFAILLPLAKSRRKAIVH